MTTPTYMELSGLLSIAIAAVVGLVLGMGVAYRMLPQPTCSEPLPAAWPHQVESKEYI